jgi:hypothetical protein
MIYPFSFVLLLGLFCTAWGQAGTGLRAEYFLWSGSAPPSRADAYRDLVFTRIEPQIYCYWNPGFVAVHPDGLTPNFEIPPPPGLRADGFSVRWTGELEAPSSEAYTFITGSDDGVRMYLNGELIIDAWADQDRIESTSQPIQLVAGQRYPIVVEGYENGGEAEWELYWRSQSTPRQVVPQRVLYPTVKPKDFLASKPVPADGAVIRDTWVNIGWTAGEAAVSHDVYIGDNSDYVNAGTGETFRGNQASTNLIAGFVGFPFPDGLTIGTTYYWRIDEHEADETIHKGNVWSFTVAPTTAFSPNPADGAGSVATDARLSWQPGFGAKLHYVYFGDNFDDVNNATVALPSGLATYTPGALKSEKVYYWRVDEFDAVNTYKGDVWSFATLGAVGSPNPAHGAVGVKHTQILKWSAGDNASSYQVYLGTDKDAVRKANTGSPEYKGTKDLDSESYDPGKLEWFTTYYWRIDEVNNVNSNSPWLGPLWKFTTADFLVVDDFESYNDIDPPDPESNRIFEAWLDGYDIPTNGALVGNDLPPYAEQGIVHSGIQSMPYIYDNSVAKNSEATHTLEYPRDWTEKSVETLSLWFRGEIFNSPEQMYVVLNGSAVVYYDDTDAVMTIDWMEWRIELQEFANQGVNLADVDTIGIGLGNRNNPVVGGLGTMYFDDIRLYPPPPEAAP